MSGKAFARNDGSTCGTSANKNCTALHLPLAGPKRAAAVVARCFWRAVLDIPTTPTPYIAAG
eukprot:4026933-Pyramimonas_sp.AAC.1